jgi:hypothetical protein
MIQAIGGFWGGIQASTCNTFEKFDITCGLVRDNREVRGFEDSPFCAYPSFYLGQRRADGLLRQLWSLGSALADVLIAIAMASLVCRLSSTPCSIIATRNLIIL